MKTRALLALLVLSSAAFAAYPDRIDTTRADLPYNPTLYNKEGRKIPVTITPEPWERVPFAAKSTLHASKVTDAASRERLIALFDAVAPAHSYDVAANKAVPKDAQAEQAGTLRVLDREAFVEALKGGQEFTVVLVEPRRCPACHGQGKLKPRVEHGEKPDAAWKKCRWSEGGPDADFAVTYTVKW